MLNAQFNAVFAIVFIRLRCMSCSSHNIHMCSVECVERRILYTTNSKYEKKTQQKFKGKVMRIWWWNSGYVYMYARCARYMHHIVVYSAYAEVEHINSNVLNIILPGAPNTHNIILNALAQPQNKHILWIRAWLILSRNSFSPHYFFFSFSIRQSVPKRKSARCEHNIIYSIVCSTHDKRERVRERESYIHARPDVK